MDKAKQEFFNKHTNEVVDNVQPKINNLKTEVLSQMPDVDTLVKEAESFS